MTKEIEHQPVLLKEVIEGLAIRPEGIYIDATFGRGGHSQAILEKLNDKGHLLVIDKDPSAITEAEKLFSNDSRVVIRHGSFKDIVSITQELNWIGKVDGLLLDLGVSSPQLNEASRGFSFLREGPLDMRMDPTAGMSAATWINHAEEEEMVDIFREYGEERFSKRIAHAIVSEREQAPIETTLRLAEVIAKASPFKERHKHPATRVFQAIRIFINNELSELKSCLESSLEILGNGGRLSVISFHSLEDRIVKRFINLQAQGERLPREIPIHIEFHPKFRKLGRAIQPSDEEIRHNPRARSAVLRIAERVL